MFPVTLEFYGHNNRLCTLQPPCYGFLRGYNWFEGGYDYCQVFGTWNMRYRRTAHQTLNATNAFGNSIISTGWEMGEDCVMCENNEMTELKYVWNSGTHCPVHGYYNNELVAKQMYGDDFVTYGGDEPEQPHSYVQAWAEMNRMEDVTERSVMEHFERYLDKDAESSCIVWHEKGFMGVEACEAADRCLFYLMLNRMMWDECEKDRLWTMLDNLYLKSMTPMNALIMSRLVCKFTNALGRESTDWVGNDNDNCIIPASLVRVGVGQRFAEPIQVLWRQAPYTEGEGHSRDEDYGQVEYAHPDYEEDISNSMFLPILTDYHEDVMLVDDDGEPALPLAVALINRHVTNTIKAKEMICGRYNQAPSLYHVLSSLEYITDERWNDFNVSREDFPDAVYQLLLGN